MSMYKYIYIYGQKTATDIKNGYKHFLSLFGGVMAVDSAERKDLQ